MCVRVRVRAHLVEGGTFKEPGWYLPDRCRLFLMNAGLVRYDRYGPRAWYDVKPMRTQKNINWIIKK